MCMHDSLKAPFCGGMECDTLRHELDIEQEWLAIADGSDTEDRDEFYHVDDSDDYGASSEKYTGR